MNPSFVNQITLSKEILHELFKEFSALPYRAYRALKMTIPVLGIVLILLSLFVAYGGDLSVGIEGIILGLIFIFFPPVFVGFLSRIRYRQQVLMNGGSEMQKTTEFGERIHVTSSNKAETYFDYAQIKQICETKDLILLRSVHAVGIILGKDNFTVGTLEDFRRFIREKCPSAHYLSRK